MNNGVGGSTVSAELETISPFASRVARIGKAEREDRIVRLRQLMRNRGDDAVILTAGSNLRYFSGVPWGQTERFVGLVISQTEAVAICPKFEDSALEPVLQIDADCRYWEEHEDPNALAASILSRLGANAVAVDPNCPLWLYERIREAASGVRLSNAEPLTTSMRSRKSEAELALVREAMQMTLKVHASAARVLRDGMKASEIRTFIDNAHRAIGADGGSTFCAVQFGEGTSHPHGKPGDPSLKDGDVVLIDTGCSVDGYQSDITRTYAFGEPNSKVRRIWDIEKEAQQAAFDAAKPGVACADVDRASRRVLEAHGLGPDYRLPGLPHRTGHGLGLDIHEGPYLVLSDKTPLASGMCFSNEPMIVVPGEFGVRLEDHFYMTDEGAVWFTEPQHSYTEPFANI
ncbi:Xaa-Pro peptidase family protein [Hyphococcus flavus]|uniref:Xaa-Pro peptidase family protein n=1 Tax=Hyphococcus flavus TaxID=1866326 RepID=A0AAE9Z9Z7_9PROT|nr:Xaa-Pro peptidase family protein [Hyphococcus flavus]WDI30124.1 Xaa-Pro peptidase family protein [Hyphococcus flavus]